MIIHALWRGPAVIIVGRIVWLTCKHTSSSVIINIRCICDVINRYFCQPNPCDTSLPVPVCVFVVFLWFSDRSYIVGALVRLSAVSAQTQWQTHTHTHIRELWKVEMMLWKCTNVPVTHPTIYTLFRMTSSATWTLVCCYYFNSSMRNERKRWFINACECKAPWNWFYQCK